jgi:hypothetical protein
MDLPLVRAQIPDGDPDGDGNGLRPPYAKSMLVPTLPRPIKN